MATVFYNNDVSTRIASEVTPLITEKNTWDAAAASTLAGLKATAAAALTAAQAASAAAASCPWWLYPVFAVAKVAAWTAYAADQAAVVAEEATIIAYNVAKITQINAASALVRVEAAADTLVWRLTHLFAAGDPLLIDLAGDGVHTTALADSGAHFAWNAGHPAAVSGWMAAGTGMLVTLDALGNPVPIQAPPGDGPDAFATLGGLDANHDGVLDAADPAFATLRIWVDADGDGVAKPGELNTLAELGIVGINLQHDATPALDHGNLVLAVGSVRMADGTTHQMADVTFAVGQPVAPPAVTTIDFTADAVSHSYTAGDGDTLIRMGAGGGSVHLGAGHDTVLGGSGKDAVTFGPGLGIVTGGEGGLNGFILVKGEITDAVDGRYETVTDFHGAGKAWTPDHDFLWLKGFGAGAGITLDHDIAEGRHLYRIADADGAAFIELDYAGAGVQLNHAQWAIMA
ncbi:MAG: hypothetical protein ACOYOH_16135 [Paracraurococcus sp.]